MKQLFLAGLCLAFLAACGGSNSSSNPSSLISSDTTDASDESVDPNENNETATPSPDFTQADAWMEGFVSAEALFAGGSYIIIDRDLGVIHKAVFGNQTEDSLVLLASTSKVPTATLLMAIHDDETIEFDVNATIASYLPWPGVWDEDITTQQLLSNRSGMPGLGKILDSEAATAAHLCQFLPAGTLYACAEVLYTTTLPELDSTPPGSAFDYGGSQWQLAGAVAETVGGATWNQLWDQYIAQPCGMASSTYGNNLSFAAAWDGHPESLQGRENPNMEAGMMANLDDYAKLLSLHLNEGMCGDNRVMSGESLAFMREMTTQFANGGGYGMGWWLEAARDGDDITLFTDGGLWGSLSWIDTERNYAGVVFFEEYTAVDASKGLAGIRGELIGIVAEAIDAAR
ncbi:MAG: serine hydrolase domain-containing protein [Pseudomonadota bacterium]